MIGWFIDLSEADSYFEDERLETRWWDELTSLSSSSLDLKTKALKMAYNRIFYHPEISIPASPTAAQLIVLKKAQAEMAYYLAEHSFGGDEDSRKGIQAQGVIKAGIVKEDYLESMIDRLPIPPFVLALLSPFIDDRKIFLFDLGRDEDLDVHEKIDETE